MRYENSLQELAKNLIVKGNQRSIDQMEAKGHQEVLQELDCERKPEIN
jgi:hypothetical protein